MKKIIRFLFNKETILYLVCGLLTTVVSFATLKLATVMLGEELYLFSNTISWLCAVTFAYITNKLLVFEVKSWRRDILKKEIPSFLLSRVASLFIEQGILWLFMSPLHFEGRAFDLRLFSLSGLMIAKGAAGIVVIIVNYLLSKLFIFKKRNDA